MSYPHRHLLAIEGLYPPAINHLLDLAENYVSLNRAGKTQRDLLRRRTLIPAEIERMGVEVTHDMREGLAGADIVMMLRLQRERMMGGLIPSAREYFRFWGLDREKLAYAKPDALVMHPGPMNRGVEIDSAVADDPERSLIAEQVEMGVAVRMAVLAALSPGGGRRG